MTINEQFENLSNLHKKNLEPIQNFNALAAKAFERIARQNYVLMGDMVDYAISQAQIPADSASPQEMYEHQVTEARAFAEKVNSRTSEYMALATELGEMMTSSSSGFGADQPLTDSPAVAQAVKTDVPPAAKKSVA